MSDVNDLFDAALEQLIVNPGGSGGGALVGFSTTLVSNVSTLTGTGTASTTIQTSGAAAIFNIQTPSSTGSANLNLTTGNGTTALTGNIALTTGSTSASTVSTGNISFTTGTGTGTNTSSGGMAFTGGTATGTGTAGDFTFTPGLAATAALSAKIHLQGGFTGTDVITVGQTTGGANAVSFFGAAVAAQPTGFGTPTGAVRTANFPGATATLVQTAEAVADLITVLKTYGLLAA